MIKKFILLLSAVFIINILPAYAATSEVNIDVNEETNQVTIYGTAQTGAKEVTCYVESPDNRVVYIGSVKTQNNEYSITFSLDNHVEGTYRGRIKSDNSQVAETFMFVFALESGQRSCGVEYEQKQAEIANTVKPELLKVDVQILSVTKGIYRLTINKANSEYCVYDEEANPFFFWKATNGTFIDYNEDYSSVVFKVDPDTGGQNVRVVVGIGDGLGQADQKGINLRGINAEW